MCTLRCKLIIRLFNHFSRVYIFLSFDFGCSSAKFTYFDQHVAATEYLSGVQFELQSEMTAFKEQLVYGLFFTCCLLSHVDVTIRIDWLCKKSVTVSTTSRLESRVQIILINNWNNEIIIDSITVPFLYL